MYEPRKYGKKVRYRVTNSSDNFAAKQAARLIREYGIGAQVDTWKGGYAVWADKKITERQRKAIVRKAFRKGEKAPKKRYKRPAIDKDDKYFRFFEAVTFGRPDTDEGMEGLDASRAAASFFGESRATARKMWKIWIRERERESKPESERKAKQRAKSKPRAMSISRQRELGPAGHAYDIDVIPPEGLPTKYWIWLGINREGTSNKFWGVEGDNQRLNVYWGRVGAKKVRRQTRIFRDIGDRNAWVNKKVLEKKRKGYKEIAPSWWIEKIKWW